VGLAFVAVGVGAGGHRGLAGGVFDGQGAVFGGDQFDGDAVDIAVAAELQAHVGFCRIAGGEFAAESG